MDEHTAQSRRLHISSTFSHFTNESDIAPLLGWWVLGFAVLREAMKASAADLTGNRTHKPQIFVRYLTEFCS